jgi:hypothetical protein
MLTLMFLNGSHAKYPFWGTKLGCGEPRNVAFPKVQRLSECLFKPSSTFQRDETADRAILVESFDAGFAFLCCRDPTLEGFSMFLMLLK